MEGKTNKKKKVSKIVQTYLQKVKTFFRLAFIFIFFSEPVFAAVATPDIVTNAVKVFKAANTWLLILIGPAVGVVLGVLALQKATTDDQAIIAEKNRQMKNTLIGGAIAAGAFGLAKVITVAFGATSF